MRHGRQSRYLAFGGSSRASSNETCRGNLCSHRKTLFCSMGVDSALGRAPIPLQKRNPTVPRPVGGMRNSKVQDDEFALKSTCPGVN